MIMKLSTRRIIRYRCTNIHIRRWLAFDREGKSQPHFRLEGVKFAKVIIQTLETNLLFRTLNETRCKEKYSTSKWNSLFFPLNFLFLFLFYQRQQSKKPTNYCTFTIKLLHINAQYLVVESFVFAFTSTHIRILYIEAIRIKWRKFFKNILPIFTHIKRESERKH